MKKGQGDNREKRVGREEGGGERHVQIERDREREREKQRR